ncbi:S8 family serine peptidase [Salibacter halophilus]|uniref:S8 family serine peptidase n=1 Tax=Salibacter halophilus TaxID=1803916 RepID=A0A6N6M529_9FLAO|nr:S8 family serine peptidase [Salibacter halophilus]KAB1064709.1 S8 family serine peptidase [Salibacter halophilus]
MCKFWMKLCGVVLFSLLANSAFSQDWKLSKAMQQELAERNSDEHHILVVGPNWANWDSLNLSVRSKGITRKERAKYVMTYLKEIYKKSQDKIINEGDISRDDIEHTFWIANVIELKASTQKVYELMTVGEVQSIQLADEIKIAPVEFEKSESVQSRSIGGIEPGIEAVNARFLWNLGYTGKGQKVLNFDTGVWPDHPAISENYLGNHKPLDEVWFPYDKIIPGDKESSHGTHTNGTCIGLDRSTNDTIGIAYESMFIATDPIVSNAADIRTFPNIMRGYEWALNPDGDSTTTDDIPDVINNSWGRTFDSIFLPEVCGGIVENTLIAIENAGIVSIHSAGNSGPGSGTVGLPSGSNPSLVNNFAVGAVNADNPSYPIAGFSSRGPSYCPSSGALEIKPEVVAPGVNVRSAVRNGSDYTYDNYQGTSMAAPHVSGVSLLLTEAFPNATAEEIKEALYYTAVDLGDPGEDNTYGRGMIDAEAAYNYLAQNYTPSTPQTNSFDISINKITPSNELSLCGDSFTPVIHFDNTNTVDKSDLSVTYGFYGSAEMTQSIGTGTLQQQDSIVLDPVQIPSSGYLEFYAEVEYSGSNQELNSVNNTRFIRFKKNGNSQLPYLETFENIDEFLYSSWIKNDEEANQSWEIDSALSSNGTENSVATMQLSSYLTGSGDRDFLYSPALRVDGQNQLHLAFDYSYQLKFSGFQDSLIVALSTDCGNTFQRVFEQGAEELNSTDKTLQSDWTPQDTSDWEHVNISLPQVADGNDVIVRFETYNERGNNLYLDNVEVFDPAQGSVGHNAIVNKPELEIFPNPVEKTLNWKSDENVYVVEVFDITGRSVLTKTVKGEQSISVSSLNSGAYIVSFEMQNGESVRERIVVR